jgi:hypothetical protein
METILVGIFVGSCIISALFVLVRSYFCYFTKSKCSKDVHIGSREFIYGEVYKGDKQKDLADAITAAVAPEIIEAIDATQKPKPKRTRRPKHNGEPLGDFALKSASKIEERRKKKS